MNKRNLVIGTLWIVAIAGLIGAAVGMTWIDEVDNQTEVGYVIVADDVAFTVGFEKEVATENEINYNGRSVVENLPGDLVSITYHDHPVPIPLAVLLFLGAGAGIPAGCIYLWGKIYGDKKEGGKHAED